MPRPRRAANLPARYGDAHHFLATFAPDLQYQLALHRERCYDGTAPTLAAVSASYGEQIAALWLEIQLRDLARFSGVRDKLAEEQSRLLAATILAAYYYLNVAELSLFFFDFKAGKYGKFYGAIDPLVITTALHAFLRDRRDQLFQIESQRAAAERVKPRPEAVTREEYEQLRRRADAGDREAQARLQPPAPITSSN